MLEELQARAERLLRRHGRGVVSKIQGQSYSIADLGRIIVTRDRSGLSVGLRPNEEKYIYIPFAGTCFDAAILKNNTSKRIREALNELRKLQVLDDLASA